MTPCEVSEVNCMFSVDRGPEFRILLEPFLSVFLNGFKHQQARLSHTLIYLSNHAFIYQGSQPIKNVYPIQMFDSAGHSLYRLKRAASKHGEQCKQSLLAMVKQFVAPANGVAQCLLPKWQVTRPSAKHFQPTA